MKRFIIATWLVVMSCGAQEPAVKSGARPPAATAPSPMPPRFHLGRAATADEIVRWDIDVRPDGRGLPAGSGTAGQGTAVYLTKCMACHGASGEGVPLLGSRLIGPPRDKFDFALSQQTEGEKTIGSYWPYAPTLFDYVRRAMPFNAPGSLTNDEVYAVAAYLLAKNSIIPETAVMNATSLPLVRMPAQSRFVPDNRLDSKRVK